QLPRRGRGFSSEMGVENFGSELFDKLGKFFGLVMGELGQTGAANIVMTQLFAWSQQRKDAQFDAAPAQFDQLIPNKSLREFGENLQDVGDAARSDHRTTGLPD